MVGMKAKELEQEGSKEEQDAGRGYSCRGVGEGGDRQ